MWKVQPEHIGDFAVPVEHHFEVVASRLQVAREEEGGKVHRSHALSGTIRVHNDHELHEPTSKLYVTLALSKALFGAALAIGTATAPKYIAFALPDTIDPGAYTHFPTVALEAFRIISDDAGIAFDRDRDRELGKHWASCTREMQLATRHSRALSGQQRTQQAMHRVKNSSVEHGVQKDYARRAAGHSEKQDFTHT